jgi:hypothetical protein
MMSYPKMRPCPKCGSPVDLWTYESGWSRVECTNSKCDRILSCEGTKLQAIRTANAATREAQP